MTTRGKLRPLIVVIDDDSAIRDLCTHALERVGLQVVCCESSVKAASQIQLHGHRVIGLVADVVLSPREAKPLGSDTAQDGNGARLLPLLQYVCPSAVAVQMSAYSPAELATMGYQVQVPHFLHKPFTPEKLRATVSRLLPHLNIPRVLTVPADEVVWDL